MPYISQSQRKGARECPINVGELTFAIQQVLRGYIDLDASPSYRTYAECLAALRGAELDLWDRKIQPYERAKCAQNGDVW